MAPPKRDAGFTLIEVVLVTALIGVLALMAFPRVERVLTRRDLAGARDGMHALYHRARAAAIQARRPVTLSVDSTIVAATIVRRDGTLDVVATVPVAASFGVAASSSADSLTIQPTGLIASGTPFTVWLRKAGQADSVLITGYGRIQ
ncbi:MAG: type II secretion system protein [Gemmatimonadales bacterium]